MHAIHGVAGPGAAGMASCFDCHSVDTATGEFALWDDVKYSEMRGISTLDTVGAAFSFDQDTVVPADELPNLNWLLRDEDFTRYENEEEGAPLDEERFDTWTLSVTGDVQQEVTFSLPELIEKAPSVTVPMKYHCDENPFAGPVVAQVEVTGIPLDWFLEQAGLTDTSEVVNFFSPDGFGGGLFGTKLDDLAKREVLLVYEVNGERLGWDDGYPLAAWIGGTHATKCTKEVCEIRVGSEAPARYDSFIPGTLATAGLNKPNVGVIGTPSGVVVQAGETYTFEGYADAFEANVSGLEFSLDGGQNWTHFDTPGTDFDRWVYWRLAWTAPEGADAAYVLQIRGVCEDGTVTPEPLSVLVNVKADLPAFEDEVDAALEANG